MKWRAWQDFGTGALGDMGCHILDPAFWAARARTAVDGRGDLDALRPDVASENFLAHASSATRSRRAAAGLP